MGILAWLKDQFQEVRAQRYSAQGIVAYYWGAGIPQAHTVKDISATGAYLYATDSWSKGTLIKGTFQGPPAMEDEPALTLSFFVALHGSDGMGICFQPQTAAERCNLAKLIQWFTPTAAGSSAESPRLPVLRRGEPDETSKA